MEGIERNMFKVKKMSEEEVEEWAKEQIEKCRTVDRVMKESGLQDEDLKEILWDRVTTPIKYWRDEKEKEENKKLSGKPLVEKVKESVAKSGVIDKLKIYHTANGDVEISPVEYLGDGSWKKVNGILRDKFDANWVSQGKESRWIIETM